MALDFPGTPATGTTYTGPGGVIWVYDGAKWVSGTLTTGIYAPITNDNGRNLIHNSMFNIAQRTLPVTATGYTLDRWRIEIVTDTASISQVALADADRAAIGDEEAVNALQNGSFAGNGAAGAYHMIQQRIEIPRRLAGDTVTISFWAKATSGAPKIGISIDQVWNSVATNGTGTAVTLSTTWARYTASIAVPSGSGKTQVANDYTQLNLWFSSGATNNTRAGSIGVQTGPFTVQFWGVQLEQGPTATPLEKKFFQQDYVDCLRYYQVLQIICNGYAVATTNAGTSATLLAPMRGNATITPLSNSNTNVGAISTGFASGGIWCGANVTATGAFLMNNTLSVNAEL